MPDLAASDVTITVVTEKRMMKGKRNLVKIAFGNGTLTYPSGGVPLPTSANFGFPEVLEYLVMLDYDNAQGIVWKFDYVNQKLRAFIEGVDVDAAGAATLDDFPLDTTAEPLAEARSLSLDNAASAGIILLGRLQELTAASSAPAAAVLYAEAIGY